MSATAAPASKPASASPPVDMESRILAYMKDVKETDTMEMAKAFGVPHQEVVGGLKSLESSNMLVSSKKETKAWNFSDEARDILAKGSPEFLLYNALKSSTPLAQLENEFGKEFVKVALANGMKSKPKVFDLKKPAEGGPVLERIEQASGFEDKVQKVLREAQANRSVDPNDEKSLKQRKLATLDTVKFFGVTKGPAYAPERKKEVADLTREMLLDGSWKDATFKKYNLEHAEGKEPSSGNLHPLLKVRQEFREIFLELGFQEMETSKWVESSFWNFDTLFVPQMHPARDAQDTFFIKDPKCSTDHPEDYFRRTMNVHQGGYVREWQEDEAKRNVLRTHTTAVSSWVLYHLAQCSKLDDTGKRLFTPGKYFSIDRVFRNEEMDKTHLCEFHQVEGFVVDRNLSLGHMMHTLGTFFKRVGIEKLRFKPAYNPYTEPSMEIFGYHTGMKRWMEVGNSGIFRPEMLRPMGFDEDVSAIAWGLSLERPTMIKYDIKNIHELFGHRVDLKFIKRSMIARY